MVSNPSIDLKMNHNISKNQNIKLLQTIKFYFIVKQIDVMPFIKWTILLVKKIFNQQVHYLIFLSVFPADIHTVSNVIHPFILQ